MTEIELDPKLLATLQTLEAQAVEYVLVGEVANAIHDGGGSISGVAIVPAAYGRNVDRLVSALKKLAAHLSNGQPLDPRTTNLRAVAPCNLATGHANVQLDFAPGGTNGYPDLFEDAARIRLAAGVNPHVASPRDLDRIERWARGVHGNVPPAALPAEAQPWRPPAPVRGAAPEAPVPPQLSPDDEDWSQEIRANRATRR